MVNVFVRGQCFAEQEFLDTDALREQVETLIDPVVTSNYLANLNGTFAVVVEYPDGTKLLACDHLRSIPIFYTTTGDWSFSGFEISATEKVDDVVKAGFLKSGWTIGSETLLPDVYQVEAGQHVFIGDDNAAKKRQVFSHLHSYDLETQDSKENFFDQLDSISENFANRLVRSAAGKTLVLPLSGGYDSRYLATLLKRLNIENVILFTYGTKDSFEVQRAEKVAKALGYPWEFIEYSEDMLVDAIEGQDFLSFCKFASKGASLPHIQEYLALKCLKESKAIPADSVIVPGFCGDGLGGSLLPAELKAGMGPALLREGMSKHLLRRQFPLRNAVPEEHVIALEAKIDDSLNNTTIFDESSFCSVYEMWTTHNRLAKFIINAVRVYEYFGFEWRIPLWDRELIDFWYRVSNSHRIDKSLYDEYLFIRLFTPAGVDIVMDHSWLRSGRVGLVRKVLPAFVKYPLKAAYYESVRFLTGRRDFDQNNFNPVSRWFAEDYKRMTGKDLFISDTVNQTEAAWFLEKLDTITKSSG